MSDLLHTIDAEGFQPHSTRQIEVKVTDNGNITISVTTLWHKGQSSDVSQVTLSPLEIEEINAVVN